MGTTRDGRAQRRIRNNSRAISGSEREGGEREVLKRESVAGKSRVLREDGRDKKEMGY